MIKDTPFVALSIDLAIPFWTGDKKLKDGLKQKGFHDFYKLAGVDLYSTPLHPGSAIRV